MIRVIVADDCHTFRSMVREYISMFPHEFTLIAEVADGLSAVAAARAKEPDVILMDVKMPGIDGIEATRRVRAAGNDSRVIVCSSLDTPEAEALALGAGASAYLAKPFDLPALRWCMLEAKAL